MNQRQSDVFSLQGRTAVVTGAARGIGRAIAELFVGAGASVFVADIDRAALDVFVESNRGQLRAVTLDQEDPASVREAFGEIVDCGGLDVLVNCAAIYPRAAFETVSIDFLDRMININLRGVFLCTREAVKQMKSRGGSIVNISSVGAVRTCIYDTISYGVAKAGVNGLTQLVALEYAEFGIRINSIMPGGIATDRGQQQRDDNIRGPFVQPGRIPLSGGLGEPQDVANAALYFASDASKYVTGQILAVDGGFLIS